MELYQVFSVMQITGQIAVVTGGASGIGRAVAGELVGAGVAGLAVVDLAGADGVAAELNEQVGREVARGFEGDVTDAGFRELVFGEMAAEHGGPVRLCVPAAGILRDGMAVKLPKEGGAAQLYAADQFERVQAVNLVHPIYWTMQMIAGIAEARREAGYGKWGAEEAIQGVSILIGSVSSRGNFGQIAYATAKSGLNGACKTLNAEGMRYGVQTKIIHPGMVDTPMLESMPQGVVDKQIKPAIPLGRLVDPTEIARAVRVLIENPAISGQLWVDGDLRPFI